MKKLIIIFILFIPSLVFGQKLMLTTKDGEILDINGQALVKEPVYYFAVINGVESDSNIQNNAVAVNAEYKDHIGIINYFEAVTGCDGEISMRLSSADTVLGWLRQCIKDEAGDYQITLKHKIDGVLDNTVNNKSGYIVNGDVNLTYLELEQK